VKNTVTEAAHWHRLAGYIVRVELVCDCWVNRPYIITCGESLLSIQVQVEPKGHCIERALCHDLHSRVRA